MKRFLILVVLLTVIGFQFTVIRKLKIENQSLRDQNSVLNASAVVPPQKAEPLSFEDRKTSREEKSELLRLRGEVGLMRRLLAEANHSKDESAKALKERQALEENDFRGGMTKQQVLNKLGNSIHETHVDRNGILPLFYTNFTVLCSNDLVIGAMYSSNFVGKTAEGIGMGSTTSQILATYGNPIETEDYGEGRVRLKYSDLGLRFTIGVNGKVNQITVKY